MIQRDTLNFLHTPKSFEFTGKYNIPVVKGISLKNPDKFDPKLVEFHLANKLDPKERKEHVVHFFLDDYLFERTWSRVDDNTRFLSGFKAVLSPDFSQYTNMPEALRIYNHYRKMWISAYWQSFGITVIPVICWSDKESFDYCLDGMPKNSLVAVSSVGCKRFEQEFRYGYEKALDILQPSKVLFYGKKFDWLDEDKTIFVKSCCDKRFDILRQKEAEGAKEQGDNT